MDTSQRTSGALLGPPSQISQPQVSSSHPADRARADVAQLLKRFENIIALAPMGSQDRNTTAVEVYQIEVETAALVRAAEDILSLTRGLKEAWLFGRLDTLGESAVASKTDEEAGRVAEGLERLVKG